MQFEVTFPTCPAGQQTSGHEREQCEAFETQPLQQLCVVLHASRICRTALAAETGANVWQVDGKRHGPFACISHRSRTGLGQPETCCASCGPTIGYGDFKLGCPKLVRCSPTIHASAYIAEGSFLHSTTSSTPLAVWPVIASQWPTWAEPRSGTTLVIAVV